MTVRDNPPFITKEDVDEDLNIKAETQKLPQHDLLYPVSKFEPIGNAHIDNLILNESSNDMKSNSLHDYAQLCGHLQTRNVPGVLTTTNNGPDDEQLSPDLALFMKNM